MDHARAFTSWRMDYLFACTVWIASAWNHHGRASAACRHVCKRAHTCGLGRFKRWLQKVPAYSSCRRQLQWDALEICKGPEWCEK